MPRKMPMDFMYNDLAKNVGSDMPYDYHMKKKKKKKGMKGYKMDY